MGIYPGRGRSGSANCRLTWTHHWQAVGLDVHRRPIPVIGGEIRRALDAIASEVLVGSVEAGVQHLRAFLSSRRRTMWPGAWQVLARSVVRDHPVIDLIHESPLSSAVFRRTSDSREALKYAADPTRWPHNTTERGYRIAICERDGDTIRAIRTRLPIAGATDRAYLEACMDWWHDDLCSSTVRSNAPALC